jgi:predicted GNAT family acetyltransferase
MGEVEVVRDDEQHRYVALVDGQPAGFTEYALTAHTLTFVHTEVDPAFEGRGVGSALARGALDDALARGDRRVKVVCPFLRAWLRRHPDYSARLDQATQP